MRDDRERRDGDARDRLEVARNVVRHFLVQARVDHVIDAEHDQRVAIRRRFRDGAGADVAAGAALVLDDDTLAPHLGEPLPEHAGDDVGRSARGERHDDLDRLVRIALRDGGRRRHDCGQQAEHQNDSALHVTRSCRRS